MSTGGHLTSLGRRAAFDNKTTFFLFYSPDGATFEWSRGGVAWIDHS
jgi:hypothetical protein